MSGWPELPYDGWRETKQTLHMYLQVVGKLRLALSPAEPQWGQVQQLGEFLLPYEAVRTAPDPRSALLDFLETTYRAGAERAGWPPELAAPPEPS